MKDTIAAVSTAPGMAALGIIRLSGPEAGTICDRLFLPGKSFPFPSQMKGYTMAYGTWCDLGGKPLDKIILSAFRAPQSYTGEDVYEINFHGGAQVKRSILESLFAAGARPAEAGEFSKRAFLNGKMDLIEAEAVMDLIEAESALEQELALAEMAGGLSLAVRRLQEDVLALMAGLENIIEFSEEEAEDADYASLEEGILLLQKDIGEALASWSQGRIINDSFQVAILGLPNAGKSSLLNALSGEERAIVSDIYGTTRDTVQVKLQFRGLPVTVTDTAGLRETDDKIEQEGVLRALQAAEKADLIFWLHDPEFFDEGLEALALLEKKLSGQKKLIHILGKQDLVRDEAQLLYLEENFGKENVVSWTRKETALLAPIREQVILAYEALGSVGGGQVLIHNLRHKELLERAAEALQLAQNSLQDRHALDMTAAMLRSAEEALAGLNGSQLSDKLVEEIFSRFCVGK